jgi:uncharacterized caspase-like protein
MNVDTFAAFASQEEVIKKTASLTENLTGAYDTADVESVNAYLLKKKAIYKGLQIIVLDQDHKRNLRQNFRSRRKAWIRRLIEWS